MIRSFDITPRIYHWLDRYGSSTHQHYQRMVHQHIIGGRQGGGEGQEEEEMKRNIR